MTIETSAGDAATEADQARLAGFLEALPVVGPTSHRRPSARYAASLVVALLAVALVPLLYFAVLGLIAAGWRWWVHHGEEVVVGVLGGWDQRGGIVGYYGPLFIGAGSIAALLRPFCLRDAPEPASIRLTQVHDPRAFACVHRMCDAAGVPRPTAIDLSMHVNAFAVPRDGWRSLITGEFALGLGAPLVACLDVRQLTSIIAHELGHFSQRHGVRAYCVVHAITDWIRRGTAPVDWHATLGERDAHGLGALLWRAGAWLSRALLRALWLVGQVPASFLSREMERAADDCAVRLVGPEAFTAEMSALPGLQAAQDVALARLCDPQAVAPPDLTTWIREALAEQSAPSGLADDPRPPKWLASHPDEAERIERARGFGAREHPEMKLPAAALFERWEEHAREVTAAYLGRPTSSHGTRLAQPG